MKFNALPETANIDWKDGAKINVKRLSAEEQAAVLSYCKKNEIDDGSIMGALIFEKMITGWEGIEDNDGAAIVFSDCVRTQIFHEIIKDPDMINKMSIFSRGPLGNLKTGSTARLNTNGANTTASNASETVAPASEGNLVQESSIETKK